MGHKPMEESDLEERMKKVFLFCKKKKNSWKLFFSFNLFVSAKFIHVLGRSCKILEFRDLCLNSFLSVSLSLSVCLSVCLYLSLQLAPTILAAECSPKLYNTNEVTYYRGLYDLFRNIIFPKKNLCFVPSHNQRNKVCKGLFFRYLFLATRFNFTQTKWSKSGKLKKHNKQKLLGNVSSKETILKSKAN